MHAVPPLRSCELNSHPRPRDAQTYLNQKTPADVLLSLRKCWASMFQQHLLLYRKKMKEVTEVRHAAAYLPARPRPPFSAPALPHGGLIDPV